MNKILDNITNSILREHSLFYKHLENAYKTMCTIDFIIYTTDNIVQHKYGNKVFRDVFGGCDELVLDLVRTRIKQHNDGGIPNSWEIKELEKERYLELLADIKNESIAFYQIFNERFGWDLNPRDPSQFMKKAEDIVYG